MAAHTSAGRSPLTSNGLLAAHRSSGRLVRIRRGLYATVPPGREKTGGMQFVSIRAPQQVRRLPDFGGGGARRPHGGGEVRVTTLERTLVDLMHAPQHGGDGRKSGARWSRSNS